MKQFSLVFTIIILAFKISAQDAIEQYANNRLILKLKDTYNNTLQTRQNTAPNTIGITEIDQINTELGLEKLTYVKGGGTVRNIVLEFKQPINIEKAIQAFQKTGKVEYVEPDFVGHGGGVQVCPPDVTPNDTYFGRQWALKNDGTFTLSTAVAGNDINIVDGWTVTTGSTSVVTCIIDSGNKLDHPDFSGRIWQNTKEIAGNNIDDDNNGKIDDTKGWDFANNDNDPTDDYGHGTNITGIIGATGNNSVGYAGMDWKCKLMILKGLNSQNSGFYSWWESAIYYAVDNGAKVINMSLVGSFYSSSLESAINYAWQKGVIVIACMGNDNTDGERYPAYYDNLIAVGSINPNGSRTVPFFWSTTSGSNFGSHIDVTAPGNYIYGLNYSSNANYSTYWGGTSQATPFVTGLASLMLAKNNTLTPTQIKDLIQKGCDDLKGDPTEDTKGFDNYYGWGRINVKKTLDLVASSSGIKDLTNQSASLSIYPNPSKGIFTLSASSILRGETDIEISNIAGQLMYKKSLTDNTDLLINIDLSNQPKGIYIVHLKNNAVFMTKKIMID